jgi:hypothetical protein
VKQVLILLVAFASLACAQERAPGELALDVARELDRIGPRPSGGEGARRALDALERRVTEAGLEARSHVFERVPMPEIAAFGNTFVEPGEAVYLNGSGRNVWTLVAGVTSETVVLSGHVDTDGPDVPGARDDGIACGLVVEAAARAAARSRREGPPRRTIVFTLVEGEERGHFGSRAFVRDHVKPEETKLVLSLDVLGSTHLALNGLGPTVDRAHAALALEAARRAGVPVSVPLPHLLFSRVIPQGERSDHRSYAFAGIPAYHLLSRGPEGFDPCYHSPLDRFERLEPEAVAATERFVDAWVELASTAPIESVSDARFVPLSLPDPLGFAGGPVLLVPGTLARLLSVAGLALALVLGVAASVRHWPGRWKVLDSLGASLGVGVLAGTAFLLPFLAGFLARGAPAWHSPFAWYVAAGGACSVVVAVLLGRFASGRAAALVGALALVGVGVTLGGVGVIELALVPAVSAASLSALAWLERPRARAFAALLGVPGVLLARPALYRDGVLTGTLPELGVAWIVAPLALGAIFVPAAAAIVRALLEALGTKTLSRVRRPAIALSALLAMGLVPVALTRAPYTEDAPAGVRLSHRYLVSDRRAEGVPVEFHRQEFVVARGAVDRIEVTQDGKPVAFANGRAPLAPSTPPATVRLETLPEQRVRVIVEPSASAPPIDFVEILYQRRWSPAGWFEVQVFGAGKGSVVDERVTPTPQGDIEVEVFFREDPSHLDVRVPGTVALRRSTMVSAPLR